MTQPPTQPPRWHWGGRRHATVLRMVVLGIWFAIVAITPYGTYARLPVEMSAGYGLGRVLLGGHALKALLFSYPVLVALEWGAMAACVLAILFPNRCRWLTPVVLVFVLVLDSLTRSLNGYINHAQLVPLFILVVFAVFGGRRYLPTLGLRAGTGAVPAREPQATPRGTAEIPYVPVVWLAGLMLIIPTSRRYSVYGSSVFLGLIRVTWLAAALKVGYFITTLFELSSVGALFSRVFRRIGLVVIISFHFVTLFAMNIFFWEHLLLVVVIFGWGVWTSEVPSRLGPDVAPA